ncbi:MAG: hypothetical protein HQM08_21950 [Candidatus Riflebacteria bacterium]|nr:hypothetical protein [Candidatus Riflebacteria bacterium]
MIRNTRNFSIKTWLHLALPFCFLLISPSITQAVQGQEPVYSQEQATAAVKTAPQEKKEVVSASSKEKNGKSALKSDLKSTVEEIKNEPKKNEKEVIGKSQNKLKNSSKKKSKKPSKVKPHQKKKEKSNNAVRVVASPIVPTPEPEPIVIENRKPCFSSALEKMEKMRINRIIEAQKYGLQLPSQGGSFEKTSPSLYKLHQALENLIAKNSSSNP